MIEIGRGKRGSTEQELREHLQSEALLWGKDNQEDAIASYAFLEFLLKLIRSRLFALILFVGITFFGLIWLILLSDRGWASSYLSLPMYGVTSLLALLTVVVGVRWFDEYGARKSGKLGSVLQVHFALLFSFFTVVPIVIVSIFSVLFFEMGVDRWFSGIVARAVDSSAEVARAYQEDRKNRIGVSVLEMARKLEAQAFTSEEELAELLSLGRFDEAIVFALSPSGEREVIARHGVTFLLENENIDEQALKNAKEGEPVIFSELDEKRVQALVKLNDPRQLFLYGVDYLSESAVDFTKKVEIATASYRELNATKEGVKITLLAGFTVFALLLVLSSLWLGLNFARWLVSPISKLLVATDMVSNGNLSVHVPDDSGSLRELRNLTQSFNHMTDRLYHQHQELAKSNNELEDRQYLLEEILRGVSAGIIGVDMAGRVCLMNDRADELCRGRLQVHMPISEIGGEIATFILSVLNRLHFKDVEDVIERELQLDVGSTTTVLMIRVFPSKEVLKHKKNAGELAMVVTIDDITSLLAVQRQAAWSDIARRIAHEIKNPLTPIQLSAERLQRRYAGKMDEDRNIFDKCVETIVSQVENIRSMVDEFAHFSRMPRAVLRQEHLSQIVKQSLFLQSHSDSQNQYHFEFDEDDDEKTDVIMADKHLLSQLLTNLLLNSRNAIEKRRAQTSEENYEGHIRISMRLYKHVLSLFVEDNGCGWDTAISDGNMQRFLEPYVTSGAKRGGMGLGLSIVRRIMSQHGGDIKLEQSKDGGAKIVLSFPKTSEASLNLKEEKHDLHE